MAPDDVTSAIGRSDARRHDLGDDAAAGRSAAAGLSDLRHSAGDLGGRDRQFLRHPADRAAPGDVRTLDSSALLAVPFFIFAGEIMAAGGISRRLVDWTKSLFGGTRRACRSPRSATCVVFGAISGSSAATVAAVGRITFKPMLDAGYDGRFATGLLTASGLIDNMIPPAIAMILYAIVAEQSLVRIFTAGFVPGLLFAFGLRGLHRAANRRSTIEPPEPFRWRRFGARDRQRRHWALGMPVIILGGIYTGMLSANEAGGVACVYAIMVSMLVHREVGFAEIARAHAAAPPTSPRRLMVDRRLGGRVLLAAHHQRRSAVAHRVLRGARACRPGCCCWSSMFCC